jgi:membrane protein implicated in regulation of membrane protease activity
MSKSVLQSFKWLPLAAIGIFLPSVYLWLFLWCLKLNVNFWLVYAVLYSSTIASAILKAKTKPQRDRSSFRSNNRSVLEQFALSQQPFS